MRKTILSMVAVCCLLVLPMAAGAQTPQGFYAGLHGGLTFVNDTDVIDNFNDKAKVSGKTGWGLGATVGYAFARDWTLSPRVEMEITYMKNDLDKLSMFGHKFKLDGDISRMAFMVNALFDFNTGTSFYPYFGAGIGAQHIDATIKVGGYSSSMKDTVFAWQAIAGVGYNLTDSLGLTLDYRFARVGSAKEKGWEIDSHSTHSIFLGLRYSFGGF